MAFGDEMGGETSSLDLMCLPSMLESHEIFATQSRR